MPGQNYVLNRASGVLHKLPASESCNTDDIKTADRFATYGGEELVAYLSPVDVRYCLRCFPFDTRTS